MAARSNRILTLAACMAALGCLTAAQAVELDPAAVQIKPPEQFKWRNANMKAPNNAVVLGDPAKAGSLYAHINSFVPGRFGEAHHHPNERYIVVIDGAPWRGKGNVVDPAHATRVPKGTFMIDHAGKPHWDGTKEESGAYFIFGIGPSGGIDEPKTNATWSGGDPSAVTIVMPDQIPWKGARNNQRALLAGDPAKPGMYVMMAKWPKGNTFSHPHFHTNDRYVYVLDGTWWVGTGNKFDPANLMVPVKAGTFVTEFGKQVHWAGAKDEDAVILIFGEGPTSNTAVEEAK
jgi:quercetin dioxygenase-like cupin family protein